MDLASVLLKHGVLSPGHLEPLLQQAQGARVDRLVVQRGLASEEQVLKALACEFGMPYLDLTGLRADPDLVAAFPAREIFRRAAFPVRRCGEAVLMATSDPLDLEALDELSLLSGLPLEPALARKDDIDRLIKESLGVGGGTIGELVAQQVNDDVQLLQRPEEEDTDTDETAQKASVVKLVNELLVDAVNQRASDIHIEPEEYGLTVRYRVDGVLRIEPVPAEINQFRAAILSRLKIMARLNIAEKRLPQDGRIKIRIAGRDIDVRVSVIPMLYGEGLVLRLLDTSRMVFDLDHLDFPAEIDTVFRELIALPHGILLVTGPTGSGKTTTLYSALNKLKRPEIKIITVEDPIEYRNPGISQIQVHSKIGLTFSAGLRSILRHDPDVIFIGEIRDTETAENAIRAALTGHLVFSTLHTNDATDAFTRLIDMGVEPYLVASSVEGVMAQRLVRVLCPRCKAPYRPASDELPTDFPKPHPEQLWKPVGCRECRESGYAGRTGIFELLRTDQTVRHLCLERVSSTEIREYALRQGLITLRQSGWRKVLAGITSADEVARVTKGDAVY